MSDAPEHAALWRLLHAASTIAGGDRYDEARLLGAASKFAFAFGPPDLEHGKLVETCQGYEIRLWAESYYGVVVGKTINYNRLTLEAARFEVDCLVDSKRAI